MVPMITKPTLILALLCLFVMPLLAQETVEEVGEAFGIDILPAFITLGGGTNAFEEVELLYRVRNERQQQLRLKLNINNRSVVANEIVYSESLNFTCGNNTSINPSMSSTYAPTQNVQVATGLAKYIPNAGFPLYCGMDVNLGVYRGKVESILDVCGMNDTLYVQSLGTTNAFSYLVGITPVLGTELSLNRLSLIIEFGFMANFNFGKHPYLDAEGKEHEVRISRPDLLFSRFLNDFAIVYRF